MNKGFYYNNIEKIRKEWQTELGNNDQNILTLRRKQSGY